MPSEGFRAKTCTLCGASAKELNCWINKAKETFYPSDVVRISIVNSTMNFGFNFVFSHINCHNYKYHCEHQNTPCTWIVWNVSHWRLQVINHFVIIQVLQTVTHIYLLLLLLSVHNIVMSYKLLVFFSKENVCMIINSSSLTVSRFGKYFLWWIVIKMQNWS